MKTFIEKAEETGKGEKKVLLKKQKKTWEVNACCCVLAGPHVIKKIQAGSYIEIYVEK